MCLKGYAMTIKLTELLPIKTNTKACGNGLLAIMLDSAGMLDGAGL